MKVLCSAGGYTVAACSTGMSALIGNKRLKRVFVHCAKFQGTCTSAEVVFKKRACKNQHTHTTTTKKKNTLLEFTTSLLLVLGILGKKIINNKINTSYNLFKVT